MGLRRSDTWFGSIYQKLKDGMVFQFKVWYGMVRYGVEYRVQVVMKCGLGIRVDNGEEFNSIMVRYLGVVWYGALISY